MSVAMAMVSWRNATRVDMVVANHILTISVVVKIMVPFWGPGSNTGPSI